MQNLNPVLIIAGPTAVGKSQIALHLAQKWNTSIISADSRQIYRYMDIGTNKPTKKEQESVPHYMIDVVNPDQFYNAGNYARDSRKIIDEIIKRGDIPFLVGGTGLYIRAVINGLSLMPESNKEIKDHLIGQLAEKGVNNLHKELLLIDPVVAQRIHPNDKQRILRAMEVFLITGERLSDMQKQSVSSARYNTIFLFINSSRAVLYNKIDSRVEKMIKNGLIEEVESLINKGYRESAPGMQSLGYCYIYDFIKGKLSLSEAKMLMKRDTRRYAKRQITWFGNEQSAIQILYPENMDFSDFVGEIDTLLKKNVDKL